MQSAGDRNDMKGFYNGLKEMWKPKKKVPVLVKSIAGMENFSDSNRVVARLSEHFQKLLNVQRPWKQTELCSGIHLPP